MARYDYHCTACDDVFEVEHGMTDHPDVTCPTCGAPATKVFNPSGIRFEGSGFYNTDQRGGQSATEATAGSSESASASSSAHESSSACENCPHHAA